MKIMFSMVLVVLLTTSLFAQVPEKMSYQAVIRNAENELIKNSEVGLQVSILKGSEGGEPVYVETQQAITNSNGLLSIMIGNGEVISGGFGDINWSSGLYFLKTETDVARDGSYSITGVSQLLTVPYALHAKTAENAIYTGGTGIDITNNVISIVETETNSETYSIGLNSDLGGYVFYVTPDGKHGLVAATQDQCVTSTWFNAKNMISNPASHNEMAQKFTDWRLPNKYELNLMYSQINEDFSFSNGSYWTATEDDYSLVWAQRFDNGNQHLTGKGNGFYVRAVRSF